jgi:hypothetical protein
MGMSSMTDNNTDQSSTTTQSFRFGSGEVITLDEQQINRIPYLAGLVSSADWFVGARDEQGHLKLDPIIEFQYFCDALTTSSCGSLQELLAHLPLKRDIIAVIAHLDFLGLVDQGNPTLDEVDDTFFCTLVYDIHCRTSKETVRWYKFQNMAARFAIALVKEEYDFADEQVMDRIYWYVMFILSAHSVFNAYLRHSVYRVAKRCFHLFKPSHLKLLEKLRRETEQKMNQLPSSTSGGDAGDNEDCDRTLEQLIDAHPESITRRLDYLGESLFFMWWRSRSVHEEYPDDDCLLSKEPSQEGFLLESLVAAVSQMVYECLQPAAAYHITEISPLSTSIMQEERLDYDLARFSLRSPLSALPPPTLKGTINKELLRDLVETKLVQDQIVNLTLNALPILIRKLERRHLQLMEEIKDGARFPVSRLLWILLFAFLLDERQPETLQSDARAHKLLLEKLRQRTLGVEELHERVLQRLYQAAVGQIALWTRDQSLVRYLRVAVSKPYRMDRLVPRGAPHYHRNHKQKPLPKKQVKHSKR